MAERWAQRRKAAGRHHVGRLVRRLDARHDDAGGAGVEQPPDHAVFALRHAHERDDADVERRGADRAGHVDRHGAVLQVDPDRMVPGRLGQPRDLRRARAADAERRHRLAAREAGHDGVGGARFEPRVELVSCLHAGNRRQRGLYLEILISTRFPYLVRIMELRHLRYFVAVAGRAQLHARGRAAPYRAAAAEHADPRPGAGARCAAVRTRQAPRLPHAGGAPLPRPGPRHPGRCRVRQGRGPQRGHRRDRQSRAGGTRRRRCFRWRCHRPSGASARSIRAPAWRCTR